MVCSVVFLLGFSLPVWAQNVGSLHGTVLDKSGAAIPDAQVTATEISTDSSRTTKTDSTGAFNFAQVNPGTYHLQIEKPGFKVYLTEKSKCWWPLQQMWTQSWSWVPSVSHG